MEKRNKILAGTLATLTALCVILSLLLRNDQYIEIDPDLFKVAELEKVDQIILEGSEGKVDLHFVEGRWRVNEKYEADRKMITVLFATLEQARPKREIPPSKADSLADRLNDHGTKVSLLEAGEVKKSFVAGGNAKKTQTYFRDEQGKIYMISIPGYRVYVSGIFEAGEGMWRDKRVFNFNWRNFKELSATFPSQPKEDFLMTFQQKSFGISGMSKIDTAKVNNYLDAVSLLQASEILSPSKASAYDSLLKTAPAFQIEVRDIASRSYVLSVYSLSPSSRQLIGKNEKQEVMLFERESLAEVARRKSFFIEK